MSARVAINGFGRIGEMFFRSSLVRPSGFEIVAINDIVDLSQITYLLRHDSVHSRPPRQIEPADGGLLVDGNVIRVLREKDPTDLPWADMDIDVVVESSGAFADRDGMSKHIVAGARRVVLTAPAKGDGADVTVCVGVNDRALDLGQHRLISNASCTTNCLAPVARAVDEAFGLQWGLVTTVHAYTGSQSVVDSAQKNMRRGRAAALNIVPTTTGAARAIGLVLPHLAGKIDGMAFRVPVPAGSVIDLVFETRQPFDAESLHRALEAAASDPTYRGVLAVTNEELVSSDIIGTEQSAIVDATSTLTLGDRRGKLVAWYDNEWGYACRVRDLVGLVAAAS
jgi:glyceraldehyde 3-phosphate dehydrogenase